MRILVVEDEHRIGTSIKKGLELEKFAVDLAFDGRDGFDLASTEDYDCLILDLLLPGLDGITICKKLRELNIHTPILILTAKSQLEDKITGLDSGADDYLTKPFSFEELLARVRALTRRSSGGHNPVLKVGDLVLDTISFQVKRGNTPINLSGKEYSLLEYLMRQAGKIISKDQITSHVWNYDDDILPNTIEVFIRKLRQKIETPFKNKKILIKTVRGFGYKIEN
ncbi:MAG: Two component transcriptional regulator, winged helix family [Candidatus Collierbacteria bacterium GW2011_GWB1_44_35]|uniref:Two component transcriptional regulator, winged helix family n=6 Tax=Candidatus Collieribacteriota TaxID=1752725 RepID=A0A0G1HIN0_9BACT|nr:MAG: Two component transcriptional regulator, winged helix family [Candidatus Collierbacteria bacterium GW2011_GWA1_44_12]KKT37532.1 MAG: Two component transcriptional regulator, winged helix family [Candidatus Collierbacteria bacterium GW2011_GWF1_44_12]KKT46785.1 MAG: Two component transcriptional regulator, winged helix family [Candidatus Collierbacteria bacterium GW2011_GWF2_44_15]KKT67864.1 MAG: Two component transcriptional regulator, winged helix family [Candidatus Collierbacteria bact